MGLRGSGKRYLDEWGVSPMGRKGKEIGKEKVQIKPDAKRDSEFLRGGMCRARKTKKKGNSLPDPGANPEQKRPRTRRGPYTCGCNGKKRLSWRGASWVAGEATVNQIASRLTATLTDGKREGKEEALSESPRRRH